MDPLTITSSVLRITGSCVGAAKTLWGIRCAWKRAPATVSTLCSQLKLTAALLSQIQSLPLGDSDVLRDKPDLVDTFDTTLTSCMVLASWLEKIMQSITRGVLDRSKGTWKTKFKTLWNEDDIEELMQQLHIRQRAISVLVDLLQMDSITEIRRRVQRSETSLGGIAANTRDLRLSHTVEAPASILSRDEDSASVVGQLVNAESEDVSFETIIFGTKVYSQTFTGILDTPEDDQFGDARTVVDAPVSNTDPTPVSEIVSKTSRSALHHPQIKSSVESLGILNVRAFAVVTHDTNSEGELRYKDHQNIFGVKKLTTSGYEGCLVPGLVDIAGARGHFDRANVALSFELSSPIEARTGRDSSMILPGEFINFQKGGVLEIKHMEHSYYWWAESREHNSSEDGCSGYAWLCDLDLKDDLEKHIDRLLEFFSFPMPALAALSKHGQHHQIRKMVKSIEQDHELLAHCSSSKHLQFVASLKKEWMEEYVKLQKERTGKELLD